tara:strand:+ start:286 stop:684 length:399 start_codon:yes stop_codon:yes gene_type:complete
MKEQNNIAAKAIAALTKLTGKGPVTLDGKSSQTGILPELHPKYKPKKTVKGSNTYDNTLDDIVDIAKTEGGTWDENFSKMFNLKNDIKRSDSNKLALDAIQKKRFQMKLAENELKGENWKSIMSTGKSILKV